MINPLDKREFARTLEYDDRTIFNSPENHPKKMSLMTKFFKWLQDERKGPQHKDFKGTIVYPNYSFVLIDLTTDITPRSLRPAGFFSQMAEGWSLQLRQDYGKEYGVPSVGFRIGDTPQDRLDHEIAINFRDTIPEDPDAMAYHWVINGVPDIEMGVDTFSNVIDNQDSISSGGSHELLELLGDAGANGWKSKQDGSSKTVAEELCDKVQNTGYRSANGIWLSNFLKRNYFIPGAKGPFDFLGMLNDRDNDELGYEMEAWEPADISDAMKEKHHKAIMHSGKLIVVKGGEKFTANQIKRKSHKYSRAHRRGARF